MIQNEHKLTVDAGCITMISVGLLKKYGGTPSPHGMVYGPFKKDVTITARVANSWSGSPEAEMDLPAGKAVYIGDACYCFEDKNDENAWMAFIRKFFQYDVKHNLRKRYKYFKILDTGGDGEFTTTVTINPDFDELAD